jgi:hypothetical protein
MRWVNLSEQRRVNFRERYRTGFDLAIVLDAEPIAPREGESKAAMRLLERVFANYCRFFDAVSGDAQYMESPFFNYCLQRGKHIIAVIKGNNPALLEDAKGVFSQMEPVTWHTDNGLVQCWDAEDFTTAEGINARLRIVHTQEQYCKRQRVAGKWVQQQLQHCWWWATDIPTRVMSSRQIWGGGHRRWDIENKVFNALSQEWFLDHCCKHEPVAIIVFMLTLFIAFVLAQSFYYRNVKPARRAILSALISIADELYVGMAQGIQLPWAHQLPRPP